MMGTFTEAVTGLAEIAWLMAIAGLVFVTLPLWFLPYTLFKLWKRKALG